MSIPTRLLQEARRTSGGPFWYLACTCDVPEQVSALMDLAGSGGGRTARREGARPAAPQAGRARVHGRYKRADGAAGAASGCRPGRALARAARYAALAVASALVPGSPAASGAGAGASR